MREFNMMEAELFVDPEDKAGPANDDVKDERLKLFANDGREMEITVDEAVKQGIICNQVLAYFMWFTQEFLKSIGVDGERLRFRQRRKDEMAHYAADCWDAEALLSFGGRRSWASPTVAAGTSPGTSSSPAVDMTAFKRFDTPHEVERGRLKPKYGLLGPKYKALGAKIGKALEPRHPIPRSSRTMRSPRGGWREARHRQGDVRYRPGQGEGVPA
jgi:glycyl-tRNA synthetase